MMFEWLLTWGEVLGALSSVLLSAVLAILYFKMSRTQEERTGIHEEQTNIQREQISLQKSQEAIQERQTTIMEKQHEFMEDQNKPMVAAGIGDQNRSPRIVLENVGGRAAISVTADWELGGDEYHWTNPILSSGDRVKVPIAGNSYHNISEIKDMVGDEEQIHIGVSHRSPNHERRNQTWKFNIMDELNRLEKYTSEQSEGTRYDTSKELNKIRKEVRKIRKSL